MAIKEREKPSISEEIFENDMAELDALLSSDTEEAEDEKDEASEGIPKVEVKISPEPAPDTTKNEIFIEPENDINIPRDDTTKNIEIGKPDPASDHADHPNKITSPGKITKKFDGDLVGSILKNLINEEMRKSSAPVPQKDPSEEGILEDASYLLVNKNTGEAIYIDRTIRIGADPSFANLFIADNNTVSRRHAELIPENGKVSVTDIGSRNGTFVNGVKIPKDQKIMLEKGDTLTFSNEEYVLEGSHE